MASSPALARLLLRWFALYVAALATGACAAGDDPPPGDAGMGGDGDASALDAAVFDWDLPPGFPAPKPNEDNPMTAEKVELGRHLFYDERLSANGTQSCASCHQQALAFTDGLPFGVGSTGQAHPRSSMSLANVAYASTLTWANPVLRALERQALVPIFGEDPVELGMAGMEDELLRRLSDDPSYQALFEDAFPRSDVGVTMGQVTKALAAFQRTLISGRSRFDRWENGDTGALTASEQRGRALFFSEEAECFHCHGGFNFSDSTTHDGKVFEEVAFHNTGLYSLDVLGTYPAPNFGLYTFTEDPRDMGRFKAPTLRNVALTAPYMHDGSIATLEEVVDHYAAGGRSITDGPNAGAGSKNPNKSEFVTGFFFSDEQRADLIAFLESLTDETFVTDPRFADPW